MAKASQTVTMEGCSRTTQTGATKFSSKAIQTDQNDTEPRTIKLLLRMLEDQEKEITRLTLLTDTLSEEVTDYQTIKGDIDNQLRHSQKK